MERKVIGLELAYIEDIKDDIKSMINTTMRYGEVFQTGVARVIFENDYYMSDERHIERDCHYIAIGVYAIESSNISELDEKVLKEIRRSIGIIESGEYDNEFTDEDKKHLKEDIKIIKEYLK